MSSGVQIGIELGVESSPFESGWEDDMLRQKTSTVTTGSEIPSCPDSYSQPPPDCEEEPHE